MKKSTAIATFLFVLGAGAAGVGATNLSMNGSDTMFTLTQCVLSKCPAPPGSLAITYIGGGSGTGETGMINGAQQISPMSRALKAANICVAGQDPTKFMGLNVSLDGVSIVGADASIAGCGGAVSSGTINVTTGAGDSKCPGCAGTPGAYTYTFPGGTSGWQDVLRVLYAGSHHANVSTSDASVDCNSDVRNTLVRNYGDIYVAAASCTNHTCTAIHHLYRRDDLSGTTDTFLSTLGLATPVSATSFCNGTDVQDNDPIRIACDAAPPSSTEQVCEADGTLGLVLPVTQPETAPGAIEYNATACAQGAFDWRPAPTRAAGTCPNNQTSNFGKCLVPQDASGNFGCLNLLRRNWPVGSPPATDPRAYNLILRNADGTIVKDTNNREMSGAFYRIHTNVVLTGSTGTPCTQPSATLQIGCLMQASPCSFGYSGLEAGQNIANVSPLNINNVAPGVSSIRGLLTDPSNVLATTYRMARYLRLNTLKGFANVTGDEKTMAQCYNDQQNIVNSCVTANGFITLSDDPTGAVAAGDTKSIFNDFNESTANLGTCTAANFPTNTDSSGSVASTCAWGACQTVSF